MVMRLTLGHIDELDDSVLAFARQLGLGGVQLHLASNSGALGHRASRSVAVSRRRSIQNGTPCLLPLLVRADRVLPKRAAHRLPPSRL